jgi:hypothetical protein
MVVFRESFMESMNGIEPIWNFIICATRLLYVKGR